MDSLIGDSLKEIVKHMLSDSGGKFDLLTMLIKVCFLYSVSMLRNGVVYGGNWKFESALAKFKSLVEKFNSRTQKSLTRVDAVPSENRWKPTANGMLAINVDASTKGGCSALAMIVRDSGGKLVFCGTKCSRNTEPQQAELEALI